jgi:hypothetical protein
VVVRLFNNKRGMDKAIIIAIFLAVALAIAFVYVWPLAKKIVFANEQIVAFMPGECDKTAQDIKVMDFLSAINMYSPRERSDGTPNDLYSPNDAISKFHQFRACKKDGMFAAEELSATFPNDPQQRTNDQLINDTAKLAYVNLAEDTCKKLEQSQIDQERDDYYEQYMKLVDDYYESFGGEECSECAVCHP